MVFFKGAYWVSVSVIGDFGIYGQWYWYSSTSTNGSNMTWQNPGNGFGTGFTTWTPGAIAFVGSAYDLAFQLNGTSAPSGFALPELLYYVFDENAGATRANYANPGVGNNPASLSGTTTWAPLGQFGSAIIGDGVTNGGIITGYNWDRGAGNWTISMWLEIPTNSSGSAYYLFGDGGSTSFRCFHNGICSSR